MGVIQKGILILSVVFQGASVFAQGRSEVNASVASDVVINAPIPPEDDGGWPYPIDLPSSSLPTNPVECQLLTPKWKIILGTYFAAGPNAIGTRVCMSEKACLFYINNYTHERNCTLNTGYPSTPGSVVQCTSLFPGTAGTCTGGRILTEVDVVRVLIDMASKVN